MMFRTFLGRAGTGKSTAMLNEIKTKLQAQPIGDPIIVITPMQGTYIYEQALVDDAALRGSLRAEVLHFERLSHRVFQELGGVFGERLSSNALEMMLYEILQEEKSNLKLYHAQTRYLGFSTKIREQIQDFEKYAVTADMVQEAAANPVFQRRTRDKLHDIGLIYERLVQRLADQFMTSEAMMNQFIIASDVLKGGRKHVRSTISYVNTDWTMIVQCESRNHARSIGDYQIRMKFIVHLQQNASANGDWYH